MASIFYQNLSGRGIGADIYNPWHSCESIFSAQTQIGTRSAPSRNLTVIGRDLPANSRSFLMVITQEPSRRRAGGKEETRSA